MLYFRHMKAGLFTAGRSLVFWRRFCTVLQTRRRDGFTIIEVLLVLTVSAFLFIAAVVLISGRQDQTAFEQAVHDIQARIQQTINEVAIGYYPNLGNFNCTVTGTNPPTITSAVGVQQGTNSDCIFMGKAMQFKVTGGVTDPEQFRIYTLAGRRLSSSGNGSESSTRATAKPVVIAPSTASPSTPDDSISGQLQNGLTTASMVYGPASSAIGVVVFYQTQAQYIGAQIQSGSQQVNVIPNSNTALGMTPAQAVDAINGYFPTSALNPATGVRICFASGGTNQSGLLTIGSQNRELSVKVDIKYNKTCT